MREVARKATLLGFDPPLRLQVGAHVVEPTMTNSGEGAAGHGCPSYSSAAYLAHRVR